jgi:hypothetical protein
LIVVPKGKEIPMPPADDNAKKEKQERDEAVRRTEFEVKAMTKEELIRDIILSEIKIERAQAIARSNEVLEQWVMENPDIVAKVRERVKVTAANPRERELIARAMTAQENQGIRASRGIKP